MAQTLLLNDDWFFGVLSDPGTPSRIADWEDIWDAPTDVCPDPSALRDARAADRRPELRSDRAKRRAEYRARSPAGLVDLNAYCLTHFLRRTQFLLDDMSELLERYVYFEFLMQHNPSKPHYRDHLVHQLRVAVLGDHLLRCRFGDAGLESLSANASPGLSLLDGIATRIGAIVGRRTEPSRNDAGPRTMWRLARALRLSPTKIDPDLVRMAWWLAALFHDTGYIFSFFSGLWELGRRTYRFELPDPAVSVEGAFRTHCADVLFGFLSEEAHSYRDWLRDDGRAAVNDLTDFDAGSVASRGVGPAFLVQLCCAGHAAPAALNLLQCAERLRDRAELSAKFRFATGMAALAILRHDTDDARPLPDDGIGTVERIKVLAKSPHRPSGWLVTRRVSFDHDPLSFLLVLCDQVQDWARYEFKPNGNDTAMRYDIESVQMALNPAKELVVTARLNRENVDAALPAYRKEKDRHYQREKRRYFGAGHKAWVDTTGFVPRIEFRSPWSSAS